jgi:hypothetical protein
MKEYVECVDEERVYVYIRKCGLIVVYKCVDE